MKNNNKYYVGCDVSLKQTAVCIVDYEGEILSEAMVDTEPESIHEFLQARHLSYEKVGIEAK